MAEQEKKQSVGELSVIPGMAIIALYGERLMGGSIFVKYRLAVLLITTISSFLQISFDLNTPLKNPLSSRRHVWTTL